MESSPPVHLSLIVDPLISLAAWQHGLSALRQLRIENRTDGTLRDLELRIRCDPAVAAPLAVPISEIRAGTVWTKDDVALPLSTDALRAQAEAEKGHLCAEVVQGDRVLAEAVCEVRVLPSEQWPGLQTVPALLAAWVLPNHAALEPLLKAAAERLRGDTGDPSLAGYQTKDPRRVAQVFQAIYGALAASGVTYSEPPQSFEQTGQRVRSPERVVGGLGTCLDLSLVLAGALEQAGLNPLLVVLNDHAYVGVWLQAEHRPVPVLDDAAVLRSRVDGNRIVLVDSSSVAQGVSFAQAQAKGRDFLDEEDRFRLALDVRAARLAGFRPLALQGALPSVHAAAPHAPAREEEIGSFDDLSLPDPLEAAGPRTRLDRWKERLLDLTLRNRLLNFKVTKKTLPLLVPDLGAVEDLLAEGKVLSLLPRDDRLPRPAETHVVSWEPQVRALADDEVRHRRVYTSLTDADLSNRGKDVEREARTAFEEAGAITLYLSLGLLKWFESKSSDLPRYAPLLLVPVELQRARGGKLSLKGAAGETRFNVTLLKKLEKDFGLESGGLEVLPEDDAGVDVQAVLQRVRNLVEAADERWEVLEVCHLARFSFTKFLMWLDLEAKADALRANPLVMALMDRDPGALPPSPDSLPAERVDERPCAEVLTVVDADPTQLEAIFAVEAGKNLVLQGPPGTGKSQTITNLIAQLLATGRTVLFVSEKMAALNVVERRLRQVGLGPFTLELHSNKASKRKVMDQVQEAFDAVGSVSEHAWEHHTEGLQADRDALNEVAALLREETALGLSRFAVLSLLIGWRDLPRVRVPAAVFTGLDAAAWAAWHASAKQVVDALAEVGSLETHAWRGVERPDWNPEWQDEVDQRLEALTQAVRDTANAVGALTGPLGLDAAPRDLAHLRAVDALVVVLLETPRPARRLLTEADSAVVAGEAAAWQTALRARHAARADVAETFADGVYETELDALALRFERWAASFVLVAFFALWGARRRLAAVAKAGLPGNDAVRVLLQRAQEAARQEAVVQQATPRAQALLGANWRGVETDPAAPDAVLQWARRFQEACSALSTDLLDTRLRDRMAVLATAQADQVAPGGALHGALVAFRAAHGRLEAEQRAVAAALALDTGAAWGAAPSLDALAAWTDRARSELRLLRDWCGLQDAFGDARRRGMDPVLAALEAGTVAPDQFVDVARRAVLEGWWNRHLRTVPGLLNFRGPKHEKRIARFQERDRTALARARSVVKGRLAMALPSLQGQGSEQKVLRGELKKKTRHLAVRKLFEKAPQLMRKSKPCVLMSPLSVAQYLDPAGESFDVVIFDEASQIPPWDAIGAIARGKQVVIVGDSQQLPPTNFFDRTEDDDPLEDDEFVDLESILDEAVASGLPEHGLRWHYRSRHETLIAFSNHHYYANRLQVFPSPTQHGGGLGVEWRPVPNGFYDKGKSRTNQGEAEAVVEEVKALLSSNEGAVPTVGVVTFSQAQQRLIEDLLELAFQQDPALDAKARQDTTEPLFVKNLENVQGDERDVMLFSICYGPDRNGHVAMNFGPLNRKGGERRLNVAVTRARERTLVFSTLRPDQIDLRRSRAVGVRHLKTYLEYAARGVTALGEAVTGIGTEVESPFEAQVLARLEADGWDVHPQVGCSGFRIDLGVVDPDRPGRYLLGVECDGATYHSSAAARERDRQRQAVLEGLRWTLHRIWSTDWWHDPDKEMDKLRAALEAARTKADEPAPAVPEVPEVPEVASSADPQPQPLSAGLTSPEPEVPRAAPAAPRFVVPPLKTLGAKDFFDTPMAEPIAAERLASLVELLGPVHAEDAYRQVILGFGITRLGKRIKQRMENLEGRIPSARRPVRRGGFLWPVGLDPASWQAVRLPGPGDDDKRDARRIPPQEAANALRAELKATVGDIDEAVLFRAALKRLGITSLAKNGRALMQAGLALLPAVERAGVVAQGDVVQGVQQPAPHAPVATLRTADDLHGFLQAHGAPRPGEAAFLAAVLASLRAKGPVPGLALEVGKTRVSFYRTLPGAKRRRVARMTLQDRQPDVLVATDVVRRTPSLPALVSAERHTSPGMLRFRMPAEETAAAFAAALVEALRQ